MLELDNNMAVKSILPTDWQVSEDFIEHVKDVSGYSYLFQQKCDNKVVDASRKYILADDEGMAREFLLVSHVEYGDVVGAGARNSRDISNELPLTVAEKIVQPTHWGVYNRFSFATYPFYYPLIDLRMLSRIQDLYIFPKLTTWHENLVRSTLRPLGDAQKMFAIEQLENLVMCFKENEKLRKKIKSTHDILLSDDHHAFFTCASHSDLWRGNVLLASRKLNSDIRIIDWAGLDMSGNPLFDAIRIILSFKISTRQALKLLIGYQRILQCEISDLRVYLYMAMANQLYKLNNFPLNRFREMVVGCDDILAKVTDKDFNMSVYSST
jgi:hypothetical protein